MIIYQIKMQLACLIIVSYVAQRNFRAKQLPTISSRIFRYMSYALITNLVFDCVTEYTVNHLIKTPKIVNHLSHLLFIISIDMFIYLLYRYILSYTQEIHKTSRRINLLQTGPLIIALMIALFGKLYYIGAEHGNYAIGWPKYAVFIIICFYAMLALYYNIRYWKHLSKLKRNGMLQAIIFLCLFTLIQLIIPSFLVSGLGMTLIYITIFMSMENPGEYIEKQTGAFNRYGFLRILNEKLSFNNEFTIITLVLDDWDGLENTLEQEFRYRAIAEIEEYVSGELRYDVYHIMDNCLQIIINENKGLGRVTNRLTERFKRPWNIDGNEKILNAHIRRLSCPKEAATDVAVLAEINRFSKENVNKMAFTDCLTGVRNRNSYNTETRVISSKLSEFSSVCCIMIDINNLKQANDTFGHEAGDRLIKETANVISSAVNNNGAIYRVGGDEFVCILTNLSYSEVDGIFRDMEVVRQRRSKKENLNISFALGYAYYDENQDKGLDDTIKRADAMMYENKNLMKAVLKREIEDCENQNSPSVEK